MIRRIVIENVGKITGLRNELKGSVLNRLHLI